MNLSEYILEGLDDILGHYGVKLDAAALEDIAEKLAGGIDEYREQSIGHIPNPLREELRIEKERTKQAIKEHDRDLDKWREERQEANREITRLRYKVVEASMNGTP